MDLYIDIYIYTVYVHIYNEYVLVSRWGDWREGPFAESWLFDWAMSYAAAGDYCFCLLLQVTGLPFVQERLLVVPEIKNSELKALLATSLNPKKNKKKQKAEAKADANPKP